MSAAKGKLIVIEGLEGAGKSTAVSTIINFLSDLDINTLTTREPGGTAIGEVLRSVFKNPEYKDVLEDRTELLLLYAARIQLLEQVIKPALEQGTWVIADRFELSTIAYQGGGRGLDQKMIKQLSSFALNGFNPDLILYLDIDPEEGMKRAKSRGAFDRIEQQSIEFFHRVHLSYLQYVQNNPSAVIIDANRSIKEVKSQMEHVLREFIEQQT